jgi:hypothetical protein
MPQGNPQEERTKLKKFLRAKKVYEKNDEAFDFEYQDEKAVRALFGQLKESKLSGSLTEDEFATKYFADILKKKDQSVPASAVQKHSSPNSSASSPAPVPAVEKSSGNDIGYVNAKNPYGYEPNPADEHSQESRVNEGVKLPVDSLVNPLQVLKHVATKRGEDVKTITRGDAINLDIDYNELANREAEEFEKFRNATYLFKGQKDKDGNIVNKAELDAEISKSWQQAKHTENGITSDYLRKARQANAQDNEHTTDVIREAVNLNGAIIDKKAKTLLADKEFSAAVTEIKSIQEELNTLAPEKEKNAERWNALVLRNNAIAEQHKDKLDELSKIEAAQQNNATYLKNAYHFTPIANTQKLVRIERMKETESEYQKKSSMGKIGVQVGMATQNVGMNLMASLARTGVTLSNIPLAIAGKEGWINGLSDVDAALSDMATSVERDIIPHEEATLIGDHYKPKKDWHAWVTRKENGDIDGVEVSNLPFHATSMFLNTAAMLFGGKGISAATKVSRNAGLFMSSYAITAPQYYDAAVQAGVPEPRKYSVIASTLTSGLELLSPNKGFTDLFNKDAYTNITKYALRALKEGKPYSAGVYEGIKYMTGQLGKELLQEESQELGDWAVNALTNAEGNEEYFDTTGKTLAANMLGTALLTVLNTAAISTPATFQTARLVMPYSNAVDMVARDKEKYMPILQKFIKNNEVNPESTARIMEDIDRRSAVLEQYKTEAGYIDRNNGLPITKEQAIEAIANDRVPDIEIFNDQELQGIADQKIEDAKQKEVKNTPVENESKEETEKQSAALPKPTVLEKRQTALEGMLSTGVVNETNEAQATLMSQSRDKVAARTGRVIGNVIKTTKKLFGEKPPRLVILNSNKHANQVARDLGYKVNKNDKVNGWYDRGLNTMFFIPQTETTIHEAMMHPVIDAIQKTKPELFDQFVQEIAAITNPETGKTFTEESKEAGYNKEKVDLEAVVNYLSKVANGKVTDKTILQKVKDVVRKFLQALGLNDKSDFVINLDNPTTLATFAGQLATALNEGRQLNLTTDVSEELEENKKEEVEKEETDFDREIAAGKTIATIKSKPTKKEPKKADIKYQRTEEFLNKGGIGSQANKLAARVAKGEFSFHEGGETFNVKFPFSNKAAFKKITKLQSTIKNDLNPKKVKEARTKLKAVVKETILDLKERLKANLRALLNSATPEFIDVARKWYEGANKIAGEVAEKFNISLEQSAAIIAALSPQQEWLNNISMADRVIDIMETKADVKITNAILNKAAEVDMNKGGGSNLYKEIIDFRKKNVGKSINDLKTLLEKAVALRLIDTAMNNPKIQGYDPDGNHLGELNRMVTWGSYSEIAKAIDVFQGAPIEVISQASKVRSFYNNIVDPFNEDPFVTVDTHATSAAFMMPMNANTAGKIGMFTSGENLRNTLVREAYEEVAKEVGLLPRELQSVIWELQRSGLNFDGRTEKDIENFYNLAQGFNNTQSYEEQATEVIRRNRSRESDWTKSRGLVSQKNDFGWIEGDGTTGNTTERSEVHVQGRQSGEHGGATSTVVSRPAAEVTEKLPDDYLPDWVTDWSKSSEGNDTEFVNSIVSNGGATLSLKTGELNPDYGFMVALSGAEEKFPYDPAKIKQQVRDYTEKHRAELDVDGHYLGAWINSDNGKLYLDISELVMDEEEAQTLSEERRQLAYYDNRNHKAKSLSLRNEGKETKKTRETKDSSGRSEQERKDNPTPNEDRGNNSGTSGSDVLQPHVNKSTTTQQFFSDTVKGANQPKAEWKPVMSFTSVTKHLFDVWKRFQGNFDNHIDTNIPAFRDIQLKKMAAILDVYKGGGLIIDLGGSEGGFIKTIATENPKIKGINLDLNPDMEAAHNRTPVEGTEFIKKAFLEDVDMGDYVAPRYQPTKKADVVHESMLFQFITPDRTAFINEVAKHYIKPDGVLFTEEKVVIADEEQWRLNEKKKDADFKSQYYNNEAIKEKQEKVVSGMKGNQANEEDLIKALKDNFKYVSQYWDSGNFKGYVSSNSKTAIDKIKAALGDTKTEYSTRDNVDFSQEHETKTTERVVEPFNSPYQDLRSKFLADPKNPAFNAPNMSIKDKQKQWATMGNQDVMDDLKNAKTEELLALLQSLDGKSNFSLLGLIEVMNRANAANDQTLVEAVFEKLNRIGSGVGQLLRQMRELKAAATSASAPRAQRIGANRGLIKATVYKYLEKHGVILDAAQKADLDNIINTFVVAHANEFDALSKHSQTPTKFNWDRYKLAVAQANEAHWAIEAFIQDNVPAGLGNLVSTIIKGNLLTAGSVVVNTSGNMLNVVNNLVEGTAVPFMRTISKVVGAKPEGAGVGAAGAASLYASKAFAKAWIPSLGEAFTRGGLRTKEMDKFEVTRQLHPFRAWRQLLTGNLPKFNKIGKNGFVKTYTPASVYLEKLMEGTFGIPASIFFRALYATDKPFREGAKVYASTLLFAEENQGKVPTSREVMRFMAEATPEQKAKLERYAARFTYADNTTTLAQGASAAVGVFDAAAEILDKKGLSIAGSFMRVLKTTVQPYVTVPSNIVQQLVELAMPPVAIAGAIHHYRNGNKQIGDQLIGRAVMGSIMYGLSAALYSAGLLMSGDDDFNEGNDKSLKHQVAQPMSLNMSGLSRFLMGEDDFGYQEGDYSMNLQKLGTAGIFMGFFARMSDQLKEEGKLDEGWGEIMTNMNSWPALGQGAYQSLVGTAFDMSFFHGQLELMKAIQGKGETGGNFASAFIAQNVETASNLVWANQYSQIAQGIDGDYIRRAKSPTLVGSIRERLAKREFLFGILSDSELYPVLDFWGEPVPSTLGKVADPFKVEQSLDPEAIEIWNLIAKTGADNPISIPQGRIGDVKLEESDYLILQGISGQMRKADVKALMSTYKYQSADDLTKLGLLKKANDKANKSARKIFKRIWNAEVKSGNILFDAEEGTYKHLIEHGYSQEAIKNRKIR